MLVIVLNVSWTENVLNPLVYQTRSSATGKIARDVDVGANTLSL